MLKILVLEDEKSAIALISANLSNVGIAHQLTETSNKKEFLIALETNEYDLIISDYNLPSINGFEAKEIVDDRGIQVPFILLTGVLPSTEIINVVKMGLTDMVLKSQIEQLPASVLKAVREHHEKKVRSEERALWGTILDQINNYLFLVDEKLNIAFVSPAITRDLGYSTQELNNQPLDTILKLEDELSIKKIFDETKTGTPYRGKVKNTHGGFVWVDAVASRHFGMGKNDRFLVNLRVVNETVKAKSQLKWVTDLIPGAVYRFRITKDGNRTFEYLSESVKNLTGYSVNEYGQNMYSITKKNVHPEDVNVFIKSINYGIEQTQPFSFEFRSNKKNGELIWLNAQAKPSVDKTTGDVVFNGILTEITSQKKQEQELLHVSKQYETVVKATKVAFWDWNIRTDLLEANDLLTEMLGLPSAKPLHFSYESFAKLVHPDDQGKILDVFKEYRYTNDYITAEYRLKHANGNWIWFASRGAIVEWSGERAVRLMGTLMDITDEKLKELELKRHKTELEDVLVELEYQKLALDQHSVVSITDSQGRITYVNSLFCELTNYTESEVVGKNHEFLNSGYHPESFWIKMRAAINKGDIWRGTICSLNSNGKRFWCDTTVVPFTDLTTGEITKFVYIRQDVTKQKKTEDALVATLENLESVIRDRTEDLETTNELLEVKNRNITDSIQYAQHIQNAFLKPMNVDELKLNDLFVWHSPKDILSGDFHWSYYCSKTNSSYIVLGDCTGHGVPGSLMTLLAVQLLEQHVVNNTDVEPDMILKEIDDSMVEFLAQKNKEYGVSDGMAVALIRLEHDTKKATISTAGHPVYHWNQKGLNTYKLKGPKSVGGITQNGLKQFPVFTFDYKKGDRLFSMSDGYVDQFGGEHGKKLMRHRKEAMLTDIQKYPFSEIEGHIRSFHEKWRGNRPQVDDVIVLGLEL